MSEKIQTINVRFEFPVLFCRGLFRKENSVFRDTVTRLEPTRKHRVLMVVDENVALAIPGLEQAITDYFSAYPGHLELVAPPVRVPGGEAVKNNLEQVFRLVDLVDEYRIDRHSYLGIIGGGAVLDMASFAATISHRSVRHIRIPTTVLAQDDSGVGVKNGVNYHGKKNFIGAFMPPFAVLNDLEFLETLSPRDKRAGMAEGVKVALIKDRAFWEFLDENGERLARFEPEAMETLVRRSAEIHMTHIATSGDPFELGSARPLDFGHWSAHKMESITHNRIRHGEAVALGMALDTVYSALSGYLVPEAALRVVSLLERLGFSLWEDELLQTSSRGELVVLEGLREFREHLGGTLHITLLRELGQGFEVHEMDEARVVQAIRWLDARRKGQALPLGSQVRLRATG